MKSVLLFAALLCALPLTATAAKKCREDAKGNITCTQVSSEDATQPGAVRSDKHDAGKSKHQKPSAKSKSGSKDDEEGSFGGDTSQSRKPGMTY